MPGRAQFPYLRTMLKTVLASFVFLSGVLIAASVVLEQQDVTDVPPTDESVKSEDSGLPVPAKRQEESGTRALQEAQKSVHTPPPLIAQEEVSDSFLTREGIIRFTNTHRQENGLPPLSENTLLNSSADAKARDMFDKQYFAHDSPDGTIPAEFAQSAGYDFIVIGENLALGNFADDRALVQAWMDSPGHRENILNSRYRDIGVSVIRGIYEGHNTWIAVQHFGLHASFCPRPDTALQIVIEDNEKTLDRLHEDITALQSLLQNMKPRRDPEYNQRVDEYNALIHEYNALLEETKKLVTDYNRAVDSYNSCIRQ